MSDRNFFWRYRDCTYLLKTKPFIFGMQSKVFEPDVFFVESRDMQNYERGFHFGTLCRMAGLPRKMKKENRVSYEELLRRSVRDGSII